MGAALGLLSETNPLLPNESVSQEVGGGSASPHYGSLSLVLR